MIKRISNYFAGVSPAFLDGCIYVMLAVTSANGVMLSSDNAAKYISSEVLFYTMWANSIIDAALLALKLFRSTAFADHKQEQKTKGETAFLVKSLTNQPPKE